MRKITRALPGVLLFATPLLLPAQGLTVQSVVDVRFQGALGNVINMAARMGGTSTHDIATTTYLQGHRMRIDNATSGTILDLDGERVTEVDHKQRTFSSMTFAEMAAAMQRASEQASQQAATESRSKQSPAPQKTSTEKKDSMSFRYTVAVDRTGQHEKVAGYDAEHVFITLSIEGDATPQGGQTEQVGSMVFLLDEWISKSAPQIAAYNEFYRVYAQKAGREFRTQVNGMQTAFASDPRLKNGLDAASKELAKVPGIALRNTTYVVIVPPNMVLDRQATLTGAAAAAAKDDAAAKEKPKSGFRGLMGAVKAAAEESNKQDNSKQATAPKQSTLMVMTDEVKNISTGAVAPDVFAAPTGYREVKNRMQ